MSTKCTLRFGEMEEGEVGMGSEEPPEVVMWRRGEGLCQACRAL
jgi:hypothetical protein